MGLAKLGTPYLMVIAGRAIMGLYCGKTENCLFTESRKPRLV